MDQEQEITAAPPASRGRINRIFGRYLIKNRLQFKFSFVVFTFLGSAAVIIWYQGNWILQNMIKNGDISGEHAIAQVTMLNQNIIYTSIFALAVVFGLALFFSHFVAGPIYRMEQTFQKMKEGDLSVVVRFRKHDELQDTALIFNNALASLRARVKSEREGTSLTLEKVKKVADQLREAGRNEEAAKLDQAVFDIHNKPPQLKI